MNNIDYNSNISNKNPSGFSNSSDVQFSFSSSSKLPSSSSGLSKPRLNKLRKPRASILFSGNSSRPVELNDKGVFDRVVNSSYVHSRNVNDDALVDDISKLKINNVDDVSSSFRLRQSVFTSGNTKFSNAGVSGVGGNVSARRNSGFAFPTSGYVIRPIVSTVDSELQNEFKKLNVGDNVGPGIDSSPVSAARDSMDAGQQRNEKDGDSEARVSECLLPDQMKNLKLKDSFDNMQKKEGTYDKPSENTNFVFGSGMMATATLGVETETFLSSKVGNMKFRSGIGHSSVQIDKHPSAPGTSEKKDENLGNKAIPVSFSFPTIVLDKSGSHLAADQLIEGSQLRGNVTPSSSMSASGINLQSVADPALKNTNMPEKNDFYFASGGYGTSTPAMENLKENLFSGINQKLEFSVKTQNRKFAQTKKKREKVKQNTTVHVRFASLEQDFLSMQSESQECPGSPSSYSPMEVSPYHEILVEDRQSKETSVTSEGSVHLGNTFSPSDSCPIDSIDALDEDLVFATQRLDITKSDGHFEETEDMGSKNMNEGEGTEAHQDDSVSCIRTESFMSAAEEFDDTSNNTSSSAENEASSYPNSGNHESDSMKQFFSAQSCESFSGTRFSFTASSSTQDQSSKSRPYKKKNRQKVVGNSHSSANPKLPYPPLPPVLSNPYQETLLPFSPQTNKIGDLFSSKAKEGNKFEVSKEHEIKKKSDAAAAVAISTQEACEKWRLRGNQAYASGNLSKAEEYYTLGLNCVSQSEQYKTILRAAMLCYSNRAATRMSLGRLREALEDCFLAASIDPCFLRVQVRAANCLLALGEVEEASAYFRKCLQSGSDVCADRKILVEASEGLQKAKKVHECLNESAALLQRRKAVEANNALDVIVDALTISSHSEKLLEMKAEALFMLQRYEEVIQLCESSLVPAERNCSPLSDDGQLGDLDNSVIAKSFSFKLWRCNYILRSQLYLGKLEEALGFLEKQEILRNGRKILEPLIPVAFTIRELLRHRAAGNEAFQLRRHAEATEHYTTALSCNVESRPFTAICFCNRAAAYKALGQITDAIADCSLAIALDGKYFKAISRRASLFEMIRDYSQAAKDLERLVTVITKQTQEKGGKCTVSNRPTGDENDLGQAQSRLAEMEEKARLDIRLNMYLILGLEPSASTSDIKKAYRKAALKHHPDKAGQFLVKSDIGDDGLWKEITDEIRKDADQLFKMIGEAYAVLSDPSKRSLYDAEEEMRLAPKSSEGSTSRAYADTQNYPFERSGNRSHWSEFRRSDTQNYPFERSGSRSRWSEFRRSYAPANSRAPDSDPSFW